MSDYTTLATMKSSLSLTGQTFADADITLAISAASRAIDQMTGRRFFQDANDTTRTYIPMNPSYCAIDDLSTFTSLTQGGATWTLNTDFYLEPTNAVAEGQAWTGVRTINRPFLWDTSNLDPGYPSPDSRVTVTGKFGWATAPPEIVQATQILASRLMRRSREAAFGVLSLGLDQGAIVIAAQDADVEALIQPYVRYAAF